jgi:hypothetical protein
MLPAPVKFLCTSCNRLLELERFRLDGATLVVTCECGAESRAVPASVPAPAPVAPARVGVAAAPAPAAPRGSPTVEAIASAARAAQGSPFAVPPGHCPKCISRRLAEAPACPSCGLVFAQAQSGFEPSDWLKARWLSLLASWGDDARHEALRAEAMDKGELAELGRLYRLRLAELPGDPYAVRGRDEVLRLAVLPSLTVRRKDASPQVPTWKYVALSAIIVMSLVALFLLVRQMLQLS